MTITGTPQTAQPLPRPTGRVTAGIMCHVHAKFDQRAELPSMVKAILKEAPGAITHVNPVGNKIFFSIVDDATAAKLNNLDITFGRNKRTTLRMLDPPRPKAKHELRALTMPRGYSVADAEAAFAEQLGATGVRLVPNTLHGFPHHFHHHGDHILRRLQQARSPLVHPIWGRRHRLGRPPRR